MCNPRYMRKKSDATKNKISRVHFASGVFHLTTLYPLGNNLKAGICFEEFYVTKTKLHIFMSFYIKIIMHRRISKPRKNNDISQATIIIYSRVRKRPVASANMISEAHYKVVLKNPDVVIPKIPTIVSVLVENLNQWLHFAEDRPKCILTQAKGVCKCHRHEQHSYVNEEQP